VEGAVEGALEPLAAIQARCSAELSVEAHYQAMEARGLSYGPTFQGLAQVWRRDGEALGRLRVPDGIAAKLREFQVHPALLDALFQLVGPAASSGGGDAAYVPVGVGALRLVGPLPADLWGHAVLKPVGEAPDTSVDTFAGDFFLRDGEGRMVLQARDFTMRRLEVAAPDPLARWFHRIEWRPLPLPARAASTSRERGSWLIFSRPNGIGRRLAARLEALGDRCVLVGPGLRYELEAPDRYLMDPSQPDAFKQLLREAFPRERPPCRGVIHLWNAEANGAANGAANSATDSATDLAATAGDLAHEILMEHELAGPVCVVHLVQALSQTGWRDAPRLWMVTRGAQAIGDGPVSAVQAPLWGLGRTLAHEHPELRSVLVDLGPAEEPAALEALLEGLSPSDDEDQIALRGGDRYVARLVRVLAPTGEPTLDAEATYLITGGLGALGLAVAHWLVAQGARHLALVGRRGPNPATQEVLERLRAQGVTATVLQADLSQETAVRWVLETISATMPPLKGILHAAAVLSDATVLSVTREQIRQVAAPKIDGAWHLHTLTRSSALDFFILFSSAASMLGSPGQAHYAAANAFLDALAAQRRAEGLPALSIGWGAWTGIGLAAAQANRGDRLAAIGMAGIAPEQGLEALGRLMGSSVSPSSFSHVGVMPLNLLRWRELFLSAGQAPFLSELLLQEERVAVAERRRSHMRETLAAAESEARKGLLEAHLRELIAEVLQVPVSRLEPKTPLGSLGIDSLLSLEIRNRIEGSLGLSLAASLIWSHPTPSALAVYLLTRLELPASVEAGATVTSTGAGDASPAPPSSRDAVEVEQVADLSREELQRLLDDELKDLDPEFLA